MKKDLTIGIDARMWGNKQTGIGRYISCLSEEFFRQAPDINFVLFMRDTDYLKRYAHFKNIKAVKVKERWYSFSEQITLPLRFLNKNLDILFAPHFNVPLIWHGKFVATIHDITPLFFPGHLQKTSLFRKSAFKKVFSSTLKRAQHIIAVSSYTKDQIIKNFDNDVIGAEKKLSVIYEGTSDLCNVEDPNDISIPPLFKKNLSKPYIFFVGVWRPHKNIKGLLEAFVLIKKQLGAKYSLVLGGEEDSRYPQIRETWGKLGLEEDIIRPGFIPDNQLPFWYKNSAAVVIPSFVEGFGLVGLEALKYGAPVAASSGGAIPEILKNAVSYFDPYDWNDMAKVIIDVLENKNERNRQQQAAPAVTSLYSWKESAGQTLDILRRVANND